MVSQNRWGSRFDGLAFMTSKHHPNLNTVIIPIKEEERKDLWLKTRLSLLYVYMHHLGSFDWFMKVQKPHQEKKECDVLAACVVDPALWRPFPIPK